uniref:Acrosin n=1 Tax=Junco hyemalis TaxID=40217 RepID=A0A8C5JNN6_JUNHY
ALVALPPAVLAPMALLWLLVLLALAGPMRGNSDTCRGTCGLRPMAFDHSSAGTSHGGGISVQPGAWPGIVSIQATWENGTWHMCTGVLLSSQWVLTTAGTEMGISTWDVVIGATDLRQRGPGAVVRRIQRLLMHQRYVTITARNDIALESKVHLMDTQLCNSSRWYAGAVHADNLCAGYPQGSIDTCKGDSGGPLVCKDNRADYYWLVGLHSWGRGCDRARHPGIYTSTQHFYNWILLQTSLSPADISGTAPEPRVRSTRLMEETWAGDRGCAGGDGNGGAAVSGLLSGARGSPARGRARLLPVCGPGPRNPGDGRNLTGRHWHGGAPAGWVGPWGAQLALPGRDACHGAAAVSRGPRRSRARGWRSGL